MLDEIRRVSYRIQWIAQLIKCHRQQTVIGSVHENRRCTIASWLRLHQSKSLSNLIWPPKMLFGNKPPTLTVPFLCLIKEGYVQVESSLRTGFNLGRKCEGDGSKLANLADRYEMRLTVLMWIYQITIAGRLRTEITIFRKRCQLILFADTIMARMIRISTSILLLLFAFQPVKNFQSPDELSFTMNFLWRLMGRQHAVGVPGKTIIKPSLFGLTYGSKDDTKCCWMILISSGAAAHDSDGNPCGVRSEIDTQSIQRTGRNAPVKIPIAPSLSFGLINEWLSLWIPGTNNNLFRYQEERMVYHGWKPHDFCSCGRLRYAKYGYTTSRAHRNQRQWRARQLMLRKTPFSPTGVQTASWWKRTMKAFCQTARIKLRLHVHLNLDDKNLIFNRGLRHSAVNW